jgi:hypothetical protein
MEVLFNTTVHAIARILSIAQAQRALDPARCLATNSRHRPIFRSAVLSPTKPRCSRIATAKPRANTKSARRRSRPMTRYRLAPVRTAGMAPTLSLSTVAAPVRITET